MKSILLSASPGIPILGPSGASAHLRGIASALHAQAIITPYRADHR